MRRTRRSVRVGDIVTLQSPDMGSISASCVAGTCRADLLEFPVQMPPNIRDCRFQIYTHCRYVCREALRKLELGGLATGHRANNLKKNAEAEEQHNKREFESHLGTEVRHGMVIQLLHLSTGKFLTATQTIAKLERDCFRVSLAEGDGNSGWAVCPVFQFQQSGYPLQYQDDFYLEAAGKRGFLHVSEAPDNNAVSLSSYIKETFEVNCSTSKNRLRFCAYRDCHVHANKDNSSCLYGDDVVTITLSEHDSMLKSYISTRSASDESKKPEASFASHECGRLRADTVWKIESAEVQHAGDAVVPRRPFRVKHVASGLYLVLAENAQEVQEICLTSQYHSPDGSTLWEFVPVNEEEDSISASTPLYIRNVCSHCWLQGLNVTGTSLANARAVCCQEMDVSQYVYMSPAVEKDDTTMIDRMRNFRLQFVMVTNVVRSREEAVQKWLSLREYGDVVSADLGECIQLCVGDGEETAPLLMDGEPEPESQHLIHEMGVLQAAVDLIACLTEPLPLSDYNEGCDLDLPELPAGILRLAYWLVKQACKDRQEVKAFLGTYVDMFTSHVPLNVLASAALRELFKDNRRLLMDMPTEALGPMTDRLIRSYVNSPSPENLCIFESICMCEGAPVPAVQRRVTENLLQRHGDSLPMLRVQPPELRLLGPGRGRGGGLELDPRVFAGRGIGQDEASMDPQELVYCLSLRSLDLFAALAAGRNKLAATSLQRPPWNLSRASLVTIVKDSTCPSALRRACLAVLERLYIDHGDFRTVPAINYTHVWREAIRKSQLEKAEKVQVESVNDQDEKEEKINQDEDQVTNTPSSSPVGPGRWHQAAGRLAKLKHTSRTASAFRKVAKVESGDMDTMVIELHGILEGVIKRMEEVVATGGDEEEILHFFAASGQHVEDVRFAIALLECIGFLANFGLLRLSDPREQMLVRSITDTLIRYLSLPVTSRPMQHCKISACKLLQRIFALQTDFRLTRTFESYEHSHLDSSAWPEVFPKLYKDLFETPIISEQVMISNMKAFVDSLLYTISSGAELDVKSQCWSLLFLHTGQRAHLIREAKKVTVLAEPEAVGIYHRVVAAVEELLALLPDIMLSREGHVQGSNSRACSLISDLSGLCISSAEADGDTTSIYPPDVVQKHQNVIRDLGAHRCLLQILRLPLRRRKVKDSLDEALEPHRRDLFRECYNFLRLFVKRNSQNQEIMFPHISLFMSHIGVEHLDVGGAVAAIVQDNSVLVSQMRDADLRVFVQAIARYGKRARWLHILQSMLRVRGQWVRRNQNVVLGLLLEEQELVLELDGHEEGAVADQPAEDASNTHSSGGKDRSILLREGNMTRIELMAARDQDRGNSSFLLYHVTCLNTLAYCCAGRNQGNQSKCRSLLSVEEVLASITSCHKDEETGEPHEGVDPDTVRFVRDPWLKFLHHCLVDASPHELFSRPDDLWGDGDESLTGVLLAEVEQLTAVLSKLGNEPPPKDHLDFIFGTCLPLYGSLVKGFGPTPLPDTAFRYAIAVRQCCQELKRQSWTHSHVDTVKNFFAIFSLIEGMESEAQEALDEIEESNCTFMRLSSCLSEQELQESIMFRDGFGKFVDGFAWSIGVNPAEVLGTGLRVLASIIHSKEELLQHLAEVIVQEAQGPPETTPFLLNLLRAVRGYLCGVQPADEGPEANWQAFVSGKVPFDPDLTRRQNMAADAGMVSALAGVITHSNARIVREVLLTLQVLFARETLEGQGQAEAALVRYVSNEGHRRHFVSACVELIRKSVSDLKEREQHLQTKLEQRLARRRALRKHWSGNNSDATSVRTTDDGSDESENEECLVDDEEADPSAQSPQGTSESGHALELLTVLTYILQGGCTELQDMLFVTSAALHHEDLIGELMKYLALTEKLLSTSLAHGHKTPLQILLQAFHFFQQLVRGPNTRAVEALVFHTDLTVIVRHCLKHLRCVGAALGLKFRLRTQILMFTLDMLQNLTSSQVGIARKWLSQECEKAFLMAWKESHEMATDLHSEHDDDQPNEEDVHKQRFLAYAVLTYLADASNTPVVWREVASHSQPFETCSQQCGSVEVLREGEVLHLRFCVPPICEQLRSQEGFRSSVAKIVYDCVGEKENERARAALFMERLSELIMKEVRHFELVGSGFLGVLVSYQNWVRRLPIVATVLINLWLLCFEALLFHELASPGGAATGEHGGDFPEGGLPQNACTVEEAACVFEPDPLTRMAGVFATVSRALQLSLAAFHFACYCMRFILVVGTSTQRKERTLEAVLLMFSFVGTAFSPFFFVIHSLEFFGAQSARMLLSAATLNLTKLGQAGLIIVLTVYLYAVVGFQLFKDKHTEGKCTTLLNCAISYLDGGLTGNGIHEALELRTPRSLWGTPVAEWLLQLFAMSFLTIHVQVLLAIFSGIIIDSFGELRDRHAEITSHLSEQDHLLSESVYFRYVDLLVFLVVSDWDSLTDLEKYLCHQVRTGSSLWLPYRLTLGPQAGGNQVALGGGSDLRQEGLSESLREQIHGYNEQLEEVKQRLESIERRLSASFDDRGPEASSPGRLRGGGLMDQDRWGRASKPDKSTEMRMSMMEEQLFAIRQLLEERCSPRGPPPDRPERRVTEPWDQGLKFF